jgi:hypothetical protein
MKISKAENKEVETETLETDETSARVDVPEFLLGSEGSSDTSKSHVDPQELKDLVSVCLSVVVYIHETLTILTEYEGWTLSEADKSLWENVLRFLLKDIDIKYLPQIIAIIGLAMMEFTKIFGYMRWRKTSTIGQEVPTAKTGFIDAPVS